MKDLSWKWVTVAGIAAALLVAVIVVVALTDVTVEQAIAVVTGLGGWIVGLFGPKKSAEDEARAKAKRVVDTRKTQRGGR